MERRSPTPGAARKREAIRRLKCALDEGRFVLHYQPIVGGGAGRVASVEALLRWRHPDREPDNLEELIGSVERSPVIFKLENWILQQACRDAAEWPKAGLHDLRVSVNLSAKEFPRADLAERVTGHLASCSLDGASLGLEVTETSGIRDFDAVAEQIDKLIRTGVELWLDDFGTGHSSLGWLSHLPLHGVKIAGTFVERVLTEKPCQAIVTRVIELAHDLDLRVVAERVETREQRDFLAERGCDLFQGFLFHPPMPAGELAGALAGARAGSDTLRA